MDRKLQLIKTEDGSHSLFVPELKETYHSFHGAVQESRHVFIKHGLDFFDKNNNPQSIKVLELGLGTGLNALLIAEWANKRQKLCNMQSLEAYPVEKALALQLNYAEFLAFSEAETWFKSIHQSNWNEKVLVHSHFELEKINKKIEDTQLAKDFNVVFFDAFAPNKQSELWELDILKKTYNALAQDGVFVTYCAKGQLKRDLKSLGFEVETLAGPPGKKEMVRAVKK